MPLNHSNNDWRCDEKDDLWLMIDVIDRFISFYFLFIFKEKSWETWKNLNWALLMVVAVIIVLVIAARRAQHPRQRRAQHQHQLQLQLHQAPQRNLVLK